jgi:nucleotide-binding universal stress UspA family protein
LNWLANGWEIYAKPGRAKSLAASMILSRKEKLDMSEGIDNPATSKDSLSQPPSKLPSTLRHILAPTDFSPNSEKAVNCAILVAKLLGAKLTLLHVVPEPSALDYAMQGIPFDEIQGWQLEAEEKLTDQLAKAKLEYQNVDSIQTIALHPRDEIARAATDLSADLLVLSTHGYQGWRYASFGSDAEILEDAPCPVLVIC